MYTTCIRAKIRNAKQNNNCVYTVKKEVCLPLYIMKANFKQVLKIFNVVNENEVINNLNLTFTCIKFHANLQKF